MRVYVDVSGREDGRVEFSIRDEDGWNLGWFNLPETHLCLEENYLKECTADTLEEPEGLEEVILAAPVLRLIKRVKEGACC